jgi:P27 family predicted phage terminase small subunit
VGARGPAPKPTRLRLLHGDHPERVNRREPRPARLPVVKPAYLSAEASAKWDELAPHLEAMGVLSAADGDLLAAYCECFSRWRRLAEMAAKSPPVFKRKGKAQDGQEPEVVFVRNPLWAQVRDAEAALRVLAREYGFTPSARAGMHAEAGLAHAAERLLNGDR